MCSTFIVLLCRRRSLASSSASLNARVRADSRADTVRLIRRHCGLPLTNQLGAVIGMGASSVVYEATFKPLGAVCAVKVIDCDRLSTNAIDRVRREIQLMSLSKHTNVLRVRGTWMAETKLMIAERFMASGSMHDIVRALACRRSRFASRADMHRARAVLVRRACAHSGQLQYAYPDGFDEAICTCVLCVPLSAAKAKIPRSAQVIEGLLYMHQNDWLHRDVSLRVVGEAAKPIE